MSRRAIALLVVLAAIVLTTTGVVALTRHTTAVSISANDDLATNVADDLARALEVPIARWLDEKADKVVLAPDVAVPRILVLEEAFELDRRVCEVVVNAWDQYAMVPPDLLRRGSPLRSALDDSILAVVDRTEKSDGLDVYAADQPVFPRDDIEVLGAVVATHNPAGADRDGGAPRLNVNTAALPVLEAGMRAAGYTDVGHVIRARERGMPAHVGAPAGHPVEDNLAPVLVARSDSWACRIDVRVGAIHRSWWTVWTRSRGPWKLTQRILITE